MARNENWHLRTFHGLILIGIGVLAVTDYWWPGIMFVIGVAMIVDNMSRGKAWRAYGTPIILIGIGLIFQFNFMIGPYSIGFWPLILIIFGFFIIFSRRK